MKMLILGCLVLLPTVTARYSAAPADPGLTCDRPYIDNGDVYGGNWYYSFPRKTNSEIEYRCNEGYLTAGKVYNEKTRCSADGWSPKPKCTRYCALNQLTNGNYEPKRELFQEGESVNIQCNNGYMTRNRNLQETIQCLSQGWQVNPQCIEVTCSFDRNSRLQSDKEEYKANEVARFSCPRRYILVGDESSQCYYYGWGPKLPTCKAFILLAAKCFVTNDFLIPNRREYSEGEEITFSCSKGHRLIGASRVRCYYDGWYPRTPTPTPSCEAIPCPPPPNIANGRPVPNLKTGYESGDKVQYICNPGYNLKKRISEAECEETRWKSIPVCRIVGAGPLCLKPPAIIHGDFLGPNQQNYSSGSDLEYKCPEYYTLLGHRIVTCEDGVWDEPPVCLEPCIAKETDRSENNIVFKWKDVDKYIRHDERTEFVCAEGYEIADSSLLTVKCNKGVIPYPKCNKIGSCLLSEATMKKHNIHLDRTSAIQDGEKVLFACNKGTVPEDTLEGTCKMRVLYYPKCIPAKPCRISQEDLNAKNVELISRDDEKKLVKDGEDVDVKCKAGSKSPFEGIQGKGECSDGKMRYSRCFEGAFCRIEQDKIDGSNLELDPTQNSDAYYGDGEDVHFICREGFWSFTGSLVATCEDADLLYPTCVPERSCVIDHSAFERNNLQQTPKYYYEDGESVTFTCKSGSRAASSMTRNCVNKRLTYPRCAKETSV